MYALALSWGQDADSKGDAAMAKPFVSFDGVDPQGVRAEVWVQVGTGTIAKIEHETDESKQNACVVIRSDHAAVRRPIKGWVAKKDPVYRIAQDAFHAQREVEYRVESQRKNGVDRRLKIEDLRPDAETAAENTRSILAGMDGQLSAEAVTNPAEDPHQGGRIPATAAPARPAAATPALGVEQALAGLAAARAAGLPAGVVDAACALALAAGATAAQVAAAGVTAQATTTPTPPAAPPRAWAQEAAPYLAVNTDGRLNLGSYAVQAAFGAERAALAAILAHRRRLAAAEPPAADLTEADLTAADLDQAASLARVLLELADQVQVAAYEGGRPNRMAASHTRARSLVFDAVATRHPVPFGGDAEQQQQWQQAVVAEAAHRFRTLVAVSTATAPAPARGADTPPRPPVEGQEGFTAPEAAVLQRFGALALAAGFTATPDSPVVTYLLTKFGVPQARKVNGADLDRLLGWYEQQGDAGPVKFREHVLSTLPAADPAPPAPVDAVA